MINEAKFQHANALLKQCGLLPYGNLLEIASRRNNEAMQLTIERNQARRILTALLRRGDVTHWYLEHNENYLTIETMYPADAFEPEDWEFLTSLLAVFEAEAQAEIDAQHPSEAKDDAEAEPDWDRLETYGQPLPEPVEGAPDA